MSEPGIKYQAQACPRCGTAFTCKPNNIGSCNCMSVTLSPEEQMYISAMFLDCVCNNCLKELKYAHYLAHHHNKPMNYEADL